MNTNLFQKVYQTLFTIFILIFLTSCGSSSDNDNSDVDSGYTPSITSSQGATEGKNMEFVIDVSASADKEDIIIDTLTLTFTGDAAKDFISTDTILTISNGDSPITITLSSTATPFTVTMSNISVTNNITTITLTVPDDNIVEKNETLTITINKISINGTDYSNDITTDSIGVTIEDNDNYTLAIAKTTDGVEGSINPVFTVTSTPMVDVNDTLTVTLSYTGSGINGADFTASPTTVIITGGKSSATTALELADDAFVELDETLIATIISGINSQGVEAIVDTASATATITDNDEYKISITGIIDGGEPDIDGLLTIEVNPVNNTGEAIAGTISYTGSAIDGTDYENAPTSFSIPQDTTSVTITIEALDDGIVDGPKTLIATISDINASGYATTITNTTASITFNDDDSYKISIVGTTNGGEPDTDGLLTIEVNPVNNTGEAIVGTISYTGSAIDGTDYENAPTSFSIPQSATSVTVAIDALDDNSVDGEKTLIATVSDINASGYATTITEPTASITFSDDDTYQVSIVGTTNGGEPDTDGLFTISVTPANLTEAAITGTISYEGSAVDGTDYENAPTTFNIPQGATSVTVAITAFDDDGVDGPKTLIATISDITASGYATTITDTTASITFSDDDSYELNITKVQDATEGDNAEAIFRIDLSSTNISGNAITGTLTYGGTATNGDDYADGLTTYSIGVGESSQTITLSIINDNIPELDEDISITLGTPSQGNLGVNSIATATLTDDDSYQIGITLKQNGREGDGTDHTTVEFTISVLPTNQSGSTITGSIGFSGTATATDFTDTLPTVFSIPDNATSTIVTLAVHNDDEAEGTESIIAEISVINGDSNYKYAITTSSSSAEANITDDDVVLISIIANSSTITESATDVELFFIKVTNPDGSLLTTNTLGIISGTIAYSGGAISGNDVSPSTTNFTFSTGTVTNNPQSITFTVKQDTLPENPEIISAKIMASIEGVSPTEYSVDINPVSVTLNDDDGNYTLAIAKTTDGIEGSANPVFTITSTPMVDVNDTLAVTLSYTGSGINSEDFTASPTTVIITGGSSTATTALVLADDAFVEFDETLIATIISGINSQGVEAIVDTASATATITDNDEYKISITGTDGGEPNTDGLFTISVTPANLTEAAITGTISYQGSAVENTDYQNAPAFFSIPQGSTSVIVAITALDDNSVDGPKTLIATISDINASGYATTITEPTTSITFSDDDIYKISIAGNDGGEPGTNGSLTIEVDPVNNTGEAIAGTISYQGSAVEDTDYQNAPTTFNIPQGSTSTTIPIIALDDNLVDGPKTLIATISDINASGYATTITKTTAEITFSDDDSYELNITKVQDATEGDNAEAIFRIDLSSTNTSGSPITGTLTYGGTATSGEDYTTGSTTYSIGVDQTSQTTTLGIINDDIPEFNESISITLGTPSEGALGADYVATATITNDDTYEISITGTDGGEPDIDGLLTIEVKPANVTGVAISGTISYQGSAVEDTDYQNAPTTFNIPQGTTSVTIAIDALDDNNVDGPKTLIATISDITASGYATTITKTTVEITFSDDDTYQISIVGTTNGGEPDIDGSFTISVTPANLTEAAITGTISYVGSAEADTDYENAPTSFSIPQGATSVTIAIEALDDDGVDGPKTLIATISDITASGYATTITDTTASITLSDDDAYSLSITKIQDTTETASAEAIFRIDLSSTNTSNSPITGTLTYGGSATNGDDYADGLTTYSIGVGETSQTITLSIINDNIPELDEDIRITLGTPSEGGLGTNSVATATLTNDDDYTLAIAKTTDGVEGSTDPVFTITSTPMVDVNDTLTVTLSYTGTSINGADFTASPTTVIIIGGKNNATTALELADDAVVELDETLIATIVSGINSQGVEAIVDTASATATVTDNDEYKISITGTDDGGEPDIDGSFTISVKPANVTGVAITGTIGYTTGSLLAVKDIDYQNAPTSFSIPHGATSVTIIIDALDDNLADGAKPLIATISNISASSYATTITKTTASIKFSDDDIYQFSIVGTTNGGEPDTDGLFTISVTPLNFTSAKITGTISYQGSAVDGTDYQNATTSFSIGTLRSTTVITIDALDDNLVDGSKTLIATISDISVVSGYATTITDTTASITLSDDDAYSLSITKIQDTTEGDSAEAIFRINSSFTNISGGPITGTLTYGGSATNGDDYADGLTTYSIGVGESSQTITLSIINDNIPELDEDIRITLGTPSEGGLGTNSVATATLTNDDNNYALGITKTFDGVEGSTNPIFTVTSTPMVDVNDTLTVTLSYTGSGINSEDFTASPTTVIITGGSSTATTALVLADDAFVELDETLIATIVSGINSQGVEATIDTASATATITDNDEYKISITGTDGDEPNTNGSLTISVTPANLTEAAITGTISYQGSAVEDTDYQNAPTTFSISQGATSVTIAIEALDDDGVDGNKTLIATVSDITASGYATTITKTTSEIIFGDDDIYQISIVGTTNGGEPGTDGLFTISVTPANLTEAAITGTISYQGSAVEDTDYQNATTSFSIPQGATSVTIAIDALDDNSVDGQKTLIATISDINASGYATTITEPTTSITFSDDDSYELNITKVQDATEGDNAEAIFRIDLSSTNTSGSPITGTLTYGGTATSDDYDAGPSVYSIEVGESSQTITLSIINDNIPEPDEDIGMTLGSPSEGDLGPNNSVIATLTDDDNYVLAIAKTTDGVEGSINPVFTVTSTPMVDVNDILTVTLSYTGSGINNSADFTASPTTVTINGGKSSATTALVLADDAVVELDETLIATIASVINSQDVATIIDTASATATVTDNDEYKISITGIIDGGEPGTNGSLTIEVDPVNNTGEAIAGAISYTGSAIDGTDYENAPTSFSIPQGATSVTIAIEALDDDGVDGNKTLIATISNISASGYATTITKTTASITLSDDDAYSLSITKIQDATETAGAEAIFRIDLSSENISGNAITGTLTYGGSATSGEDYADGLTTYSIEINETSQTIALAIINDNIPEPDKDISMTLGTPSEGGLGTNSVATATLTNDDDYTLAIAKTTDGVEGSTDPVFTVTSTPMVDVNDTLTVTLSYTGSGINSEDFTASPTTVIITGGSSTATTALVLADDAFVELDETLIATIVSGINSQGVEATIDTASATATITDNDEYKISIAGTDGGEPGTDGSFTISVTPANLTEAVITGTISYTGSAIDGTDYQNAPTSFSIPQSATSVTIAIEALDDDSVDGQKTLIATISDINASGYATTITKTTSEIIFGDDDNFGISVELSNDGVTSELGTTINMAVVLDSVPTHNVTATFTINDTSEHLFFVSGTLADDPEVSSTAVGNISNPISNGIENDEESFNTEGNDVPDTFYFDITTPEPLTDANEIIMESGATGIGIAIYQNGGDLLASIGDDNDASDITANNVFEAGKRYAIIVELRENNQVTFYVSEKQSNNLPITMSQVATGQWTGGNDWSGSHVGGWGQAGDNLLSNVQGSNEVAYSNYTGTFHEGRFYSGDTKDSIWTDSPTPQMMIAVFTPNNWNQTQTFFIQGQADDLVDTDIENTIASVFESQDSGYDGLPVADIALTNLNIDETTIGFSSTQSSGLESVNSINIVLELTKPSVSDITVDFIVDDSNSSASSEDDYSLETNSATIPAGNTSQTISIEAIIDDNDVENAEVLVIALSNPNGATLSTNPTYTYTILDNDTYSLSITKVQDVTEGDNAEAIFRIDLSSTNISGNAIAGTLTYGGSATSGDDYTAGPTTYSIGADASSQTIALAIINDDIPELEEDISITLGTPSQGELGTDSVATATLSTDNDLYDINISSIADSSEDIDTTTIIIDSPDNDIAGEYNLVTDTAGLNFSADFEPFNSQGASFTIPTEIDNTKPVYQRGDWYVWARLDATNSNGDGVGYHISQLNDTTKWFWEGVSDANDFVDDPANVTNWRQSAGAASAGIESTTPTLAIEYNSVRFLISVTPVNVSGADITGNITFDGSASQEDFSSTFLTQFSIANGESETIIELLVEDDELIEGSESLTATIDNINTGAYDNNISTDSASVNIEDNDRPAITSFASLYPKMLDINWDGSNNVNSYSIHENIDGSAGFNEIGTTSNISYSTPVSLIGNNRVTANTQYMVEAKVNNQDIESTPENLTQTDITNLIGYIKASNTGATDRFGQSVALSADGKTLAVGATYEGSNAIGIDGDGNNDSAVKSGAAYIFTLVNNIWTQTAYVKASNTDGDDQFGTSIALNADGTILAVGSRYEDSNGTTGRFGAVYLFTLGSSSWTETAYIKANNPDDNDGFGKSIALSEDGTTLAVGAMNESSNSTGTNGDSSNNNADKSGAVYIFTSESSWTQTAYIKANNTDENDKFGFSIALSADGKTLAVGAKNESSNSTGTNGDSSNNDADKSGAVYIFTLGSTWTQTAYIKANNTDANDEFGSIVALSDDGKTLAVGARNEGSNATGINGDVSDNSESNSGAVYIFTLGSTWTQTAYIKASNTDDGDLFGGNSISLSADGTVLAVGAINEDSSATGIGGDVSDNSKSNSGAAYLFTLDGSWTQVAYIKASNTGNVDLFGMSVSLSADGTTLAVGARSEGSNATGINGDQNNDGATESGAVYLY